MTRDQIAAELARFIEFPDGSDGRFVTTTSCLLFAGHIAELQRSEIASIIKAQDIDPAFKHRLLVAIAGHCVS